MDCSREYFAGIDTYFTLAVKVEKLFSYQLSGRRPAFTVFDQVIGQSVQTFNTW